MGKLIIHNGQYVDEGAEEVAPRPIPFKDASKIALMLAKRVEKVYNWKTKLLSHQQCLETALKMVLYIKVPPSYEFFLLLNDSEILSEANRVRWMIKESPHKNHERRES